MTMEQKENVLDYYCCGRRCGDCVLSNGWCDADDGTEESLDKALKLIATDATFETNEEIKPNNVDHPSHYNQGGMECIDEMIMVFGKSAVMNFCLCNAWKYRYRANAKNGQEDLDKANWYIAKYKELKEGCADENN